MANAVAHIHSMDIVHNDVKADNFFYFKAENCVKLADFEFALPESSKLTGKEQWSKFANKNRDFLPPEIQCRQNRAQSSLLDLKQADVFNLGLTLFCGLF